MGNAQMKAINPWARPYLYEYLDTGTIGRVFPNQVVR